MATNEVVAQYKIEVAKARKELDKLAGRVTNVEKTAQKSAKKTEAAFNKMATNAGNSFKRMGAQLVAALGVGSAIFALTSAFKGLININKEFELQMARVRAITGATNKEFKQLSDNAKLLGSSTKFTATEVGNLQEEFAKLGFSTKEIIAATEATLLLAEATGSELAQAANVAGQVLRAFNLDASETQRVVDVMAASFASSALNMENFQEAMKFVAPIASRANISIETTVSLLAKLADAGLRGSIAGTGLKNLLTNLADGGSKLSQKLGFAVRSSEDLFKAFKILKGGSVELTEALALTDKRSLAAFLTLIEGVESAEQLKEAFDNAGGAAEDMALIMRDTLSGDIDQLKAKTEGLALALGEGEGGLAVALRRAVRNLTVYIGVLREAALSTEQLLEEKTIDQFTRSLKRAKKAIDDESTSIDDQIKKFGELAIEVAGFAEIQLKLNNLDRASELRAEAEAYSLVRKALQETKEAQKELNEEVEAGNTEALVRSIKLLGEQLKKLKKDLKESEIGSGAFFDALDKVTVKTKELKEALAFLNLDAALKVDPDGDAVAGFEIVGQGATDLGALLEEAFGTEGSDRINAFWENFTNDALEAMDATDARLDKQLDTFKTFATESSRITNALSQLVSQAADEELLSLQRKLDARLISEEEFDVERRKILKKQAEDEKIFALFDATINGLVAVVNAFAEGGPVLAAVVGAAVALEIAAIASKPIPQFAEGVIGLKGAGTGTSDSIPAMLSRNESVMTDEETRKYGDIFHAIRNKSWEQYKFENIIAPEIDNILKGGWGGLNQSVNLNSKFNDRNMLKATDRLRNSNRMDAHYIVEEFRAIMKPRKRGGYV